MAEHPFDGSWGFQSLLGLFAPSARFGTPDAFARFVNPHERGIGVLVDWVPAHFPSDAHGLAHFDGTALYRRRPA